MPERNLESGNPGKKNPRMKLRGKEKEKTHPTEKGEVKPHITTPRVLRTGFHPCSGAPPTWFFGWARLFRLH